MRTYQYGRDKQRNLVVCPFSYIVTSLISTEKCQEIVEKTALYFALKFIKLYLGLKNAHFLCIL